MASEQDPAQKSRTKDYNGTHGGQHHEFVNSAKGEIEHIVREGYTFGLPLLALGALAFFARWHLLGALLVALALFGFSFFRDPERAIPAGAGAIVSPADGRFLVVTDEEHSGNPGKRVSIFLTIWNVHVNRAPAAGAITRLDYRPGKFFAAMRERASFENEQNVIRLQTDAGELVFKQIAGWIARRVVCWKKAGDAVARGERIGLVRFGSRVDLWLPREAVIRVSVGDSVKGGSSVLGIWQGTAPRSNANLFASARTASIGPGRES
jgi:phosphatidylserine decarboxylase